MSQQARGIFTLRNKVSSGKTPDGRLYQPGSKSQFRNYLIEQAEAVMESPPCQVTCIYDGMAIIRASSPAATLGQYMYDQLKAFTPPASWYAKETVVVFDNYSDDQEFSIKEAERLERGCSPGGSSGIK